MRHIAAIPRLRVLQAQGTVATDDGFVAIGKSRSIEAIWGRECRTARERLRGVGGDAGADEPRRQLQARRRRRTRVAADASRR